MTEIKDETTEELVAKDLKPENRMKLSPGNPTFHKGMTPWNKGKSGYKRKPKELTMKQKKYVKEKIEGKTGTDAVINAGYDVKDRNSASSIAYENNQAPAIKEEISRALTSLAITPEDILKTLQRNVKQSSNYSASIVAIKFLFELMGWSKDKAEEEVQKIVFNIDKAVIPLTVANTSAVQPTPVPPSVPPTEKKTPIEGQYEEVTPKEPVVKAVSTDRAERVDPVAHLRKNAKDSANNPDADPIGGHVDP